MHILVATGNTHKLEEIKAFLRGFADDLVGLDRLENPPEIDEDGDTFAANAEKKARVMAAFSGMWTLADDSGLEVDALGGTHELCGQHHLQAHDGAPRLPSRRQTH